MISVDSVWKSYNTNTVLKGLSFGLETGEIVGLTGPSGAGKSVLLKLLGGVEQPDSGSITHSDSSEDFSVGFLFQEGALFDSMSVLENVAFPLTSAKQYRRAHTSVSREEALNRAYAILKEVGLSAAYRKLPGQLSGGMRRRVGIARALVGNPDLVLLDDPTGGLDPVAASVIMNLIAKLHAQFKPTVLMVSHDIRRLLPNVERVLALFDGNLLTDAPTEQLAADAHPSVMKFLATRFDFSAS